MPKTPHDISTALWAVSAGKAELRDATPGAPGAGEVQARALVSGISRGTESLVFQGLVPKSEWARMRCPNQEGDFPFPVKYGYALVGEVVAEGKGVSGRLGQRVLALHPHQSLLNLPVEAVLAVPAEVSTERAALAPQMETALNALWDGAPRKGARIAVVGGGAIGLLTAYLCQRLAKAEVTLIDANPAKAAVAKGLGLPFAAPADAPTGCDLVFHASGSADGLNLSLDLCAFEATVIELSWYGDKTTPLRLGGAFHSQRLTLRASQVGSVSPAKRRAGWDYTRRLTKALSLCADPALDILVSQQTPLKDMPARYGEVLSDPATLFHLIRYPEA